MKMSDYFSNPVSFVGDTIECAEFAYAVTTCEWEVNGVDFGHAIVHAINSHDQLQNRIADLERQLKAEREINDRLRVVETERAVRNDELYECLMDISKCGVMAGKYIQRVTREALEKHSHNYGERPLRYIAVHPNGTTSGFHHGTKDEIEKIYKPSMSDWEIIPIRVSGDCDDSH
ncbi:hypothetical protein [Vibrio phage Artemius]|nr:hypothetical protein [Vibrio phage Artemius]